MNMIKTSSFDDLLSELDKDPNFREEYRKQAPYYDPLVAIIKQRRIERLTQEVSARKDDTQRFS